MKARPIGRYPVTTALGLAWCLFFLLMGWRIGLANTLLAPTRTLFGGYVPTDLSHLFGDVTPRELYAGQWWRALTATFVHFNVLHLLLNLIGLIQLGRLLEGWYGSSVFLLIYVVIGGLGNLGANLARPWLGDSVNALQLHSGGGSTVVLGLVGLVTVVGWRNPDEFPKRARWWLLALLAINAGLGFFVPNIDNLGHFAGIAVGAVIGLLDRRFLALAERPAPRRALGLASAAVLLLSLASMAERQQREMGLIREGLQAQQALRESTLRLNSLGRLRFTYQAIGERGWQHRDRLMPKSASNPTARPIPLARHPELDRAYREMLRQQLSDFRQRFASDASGKMALNYRRCVEMAAHALSKPPTASERVEFANAIGPMIAREAGAMLAAQGRLQGVGQRSREASR